MAETRSAREPLPPLDAGSRQAADGAAPNSAHLPARRVLEPAAPGVATGVPVAEVPPLVEPITVGFDEPPAVEIRAPAANRRPVRRRFLAPVAPPVAADRDELPPSRESRPRLPPPPAPPPEPAAAPPRTRRRLVLVGAGVVVALSIAMAFEVGVSLDALRRLPGAVLHRLTLPPLPPRAAKPPTEPAARADYYAARAERGDAEAELALAILYAKGEGVRQDYATAAAWFRRAAEQGLARAQYDLGVLYERGRGVPIDFAQAASWYRKAAAQNHPLAQYNLAVAYTKGQGVRRDPSEAVVWYHRAAAQGVVAAMVNLAILYERGEGVDASTADAYAWYRAAAERGSAPAARRAETLLRAFSPSEQTFAEAKTADVAASIRDARGARARRAARTATAERSEPVLKSGIVSKRTATSEAAGETLSPPAPNDP